MSSSVDRAPEPGDARFDLVVISQDCDLVCEPEIEPFVELVLCRGIEAVEPLYQSGRNPRLLHIRLIGPEERQSWLEISVHDRFRIGKEVLARLLAGNAARLEVGDVRLLSRWIARRYTRPAFPDEFNRRLEVVDRKLEKLYKSREGRVVTGLFLEVGDGEHSPTQPYNIGARITAKLEIWEDEESR